VLAVSTARQEHGGPRAPHGHRPNAAPLRAEPRNVENLIIAANNSWIVNSTTWSAYSRVLDALCRITTGGGLSRRELYTDDGESILNVKRRSSSTASRDRDAADLLSRSILVTLPTIPRTSANRSASSGRPSTPPTHDSRALLDAASMALKRVGEVHFDRLPRMADFVIWVTPPSRRSGGGT